MQRSGQYSPTLRLSLERDPVKRRSKPSLLLLDQDFKIAFSEPAALALVERLCAEPCLDRLPEPVERSIRAVMAAAGDSGHGVVMPVPGLLAHTSRLSGRDGTFTAVLLEQESRRGALRGATERFALSRREVDVLRLLLRGIGTNEVARELEISESTVTGYFKGLLRKTGSHSRSEMVAKVLGWDIDDVPTL